MRKFAGVARPCMFPVSLAPSMELARRYRLELLWMADDNFLVDLDRSLKIAEGLVRAGSTFKWSVQATTNLTARLSIDELTLLRRSGLHQICQGIETASPTVMKLMNKDLQILGDIYQSTERCIRAGVIPSFNIIFGFPGEGPKERRETVNFMMDICQKFPGAEFWTNIFTPYLGSPIFHQAAKLGIEVPKSFEGWVDYFSRYTVCPGSKEKIISGCKPCGIICVSPLIGLPSRPLVTAALRRRFNISLPIRLVSA
jgi:anaerobic magnesium-protoporphyrin IX monomethyl ester cyclase